MPRLFSETLYRTQIREGVPVDFLHLGESEMTEVVDLRDGFAHVIVMVEDTSNGRHGRTWKNLELVNRCTVFDSSMMWVDKNCAHLKSQMIRKATMNLNVTHTISITNSI